MESLTKTVAGNTFSMCIIIIILFIIGMFAIHYFCNKHSIYDFSKEDYILHKTILDFKV